MADDKDQSQQTEEPTQRRLDDARDSGDIVKSHELSTFILLAGGTLSIAVFGRSTAIGIATIMRTFFEQPDQLGVSSDQVMALAQHVVLALAGILAAPTALIVGSALAGHLVQGRPTFTTERMSLDLTKLSPMAGLKRMFGMDGLTNLGKGLIKIAIVGTVLWVVLWPERNGLERVLDESPVAVAGDMTRLLIKIAIAVLCVLAVVAGADYFIQRFRFLQRNRMSKQEIKDEFRQTEGDPVIRARLRQIRQERARKRMIAAVPEATVIITNPTHYAVALKYESGQMAAPVCVAKGVDALALRIREVAKEHGVPVVENPPLARALHATVDVDEAIPPEHYKAVAQIIGYILRLSGKVRAQR
jgi:flagellar biosynthetic protein FlhB